MGKEKELLKIRLETATSIIRQTGTLLEDLTGHMQTLRELCGVLLIGIEDIDAEAIQRMLEDGYKLQTHVESLAADLRQYK